MYGNTEFPREWLKEVVSYFGKMGFFQGDEPTDRNLDFLERMANLDEAFLSGPLIPEIPETEQKLLRLKYGDGKRVWFEDAEANFVEGDYWYVRTLLDWSQISRGCFKPQNLSEVWLPPRPDPDSPNCPDEPIEMSFTVGGKEWKFEVEYRGGWFDYSLIGKVNKAIYSTGYQFASVWIHDQCAYVCCLTMAEVGKLRDERKWRFHEEFFYSP
jgi:hypothetical protein